MKKVKLGFLFLLGTILFSCGNQQANTSKVDYNTSDSVKIIQFDSFYLEESEINSNEWKEFKNDSSTVISPFQLELDKALQKEFINDYYKEVYQKEKLVEEEGNLMLSITDSLFTTDPETDLFYFLVFTKSMNEADGFYSEALNIAALEFVIKKTEWFADYFNIAPGLTDKDMVNWASAIYSEIQISEEDETEAILELEKQLLENIKESRKEYRAIIETLLAEIKMVHYQAN
jgi:hypothetical protein